MTGTVVDQFVVKYTLDTSGIAAGAKDVEKAMEGLRGRSAAAGKGLGAGLEAGAKRATNSLGYLGTLLGRGGVVGLAIGATIGLGVKLDDKLSGIAKTIRHLGIDARNFDMTAAGLRNMQNAAEMAGGSLEDATQTAGDLKQSLFDLKFNGQVSESLVMLARLGVHFQDAYGHAKDFKDITLDLASALEKNQATGRMTQSEAFFAASQAGYTGGMAQLVLGGRSHAEQELAKQTARRQVNANDVAAGTRMDRASASLAQATVAEIGNAAVGSLGDARAAANEKLESSGKYAADALKDLGDAVEQVASRIMSAVGGVFTGHTTGGRGRSGGFTGGGSVGGQVTRGLRNNNPGNLRAVGDQPHDADGFRVFPTMAEGIAANVSQLNRYAGRGINTPESIISTWAPAKENNTRAYTADVLKRTGFKAGQQLTPSDRMKLMAAMFAHESGTGAPGLGAIESIAKALPSPAAQGMGSSPSTTVNIGDINVNTSSQDPLRHGQVIADVTKRKLMMAHADTATQ